VHSVYQGFYSLVCFVVKCTSFTWLFDDTETTVDGIQCLDEGMECNANFKYGRGKGSVT
jgi:hypothetical protein